jgi:hypothetical protein
LLDLCRGQWFDDQSVNSLDLAWCRCPSPCVRRVTGHREWRVARLADDAETAGPANLLADREGQLEESDCFQFACPAQVPGIDRVDSANRDGRCQGGFRVRVVACDQCPRR